MRRDLTMYSGAHRAKAPLTNATQVNPAEDSMKLLLQPNNNNTFAATEPIEHG